VDRIGGLGPFQPFLPRKEDPGAKKGRKAGEAAKPSFLNFLNRPEPEAADLAPAAGSPEAEAQVEALLDEVYQLGQDLARNPLPETVIAYKKAVGRFIRRVVEGAVEVVETEGRMRKDFKKPKYAVLHVVDEKLDKLGAYVLQNQRDKLEILRRVDELHGLLVDLRH